jgi:DNA polymerase-3 subunit epsilon
VLVAHNAAFDMKFLELQEKASGVSFTNPVLDILLLSAFLHDHTADHSLNATAERLGISVSGRHTALGDAMTTAAIFLSMLDPLEERGVVTLGDALKVSSKQVKIRKMQAKF